MDDLTKSQNVIVDGLRRRYPSIHPVVFRRMLERSRDETELFDILDTVPDFFPLAFDAETRRLVGAADVQEKITFLS